MSLPEPPLKIFVSYKSKDAAAALEIKNNLEALSAGKINVFVSCSPDSLPASAPYRIKIAQELRAAHCLIFLYTDARQRWDWGFYETGFFEGAKVDNAQLYVLHARHTPPPAPLEALQAVVISSDAPSPGGERGSSTDSQDNGHKQPLALEGLLEALFCKSTNPPINKDFRASAAIYQAVKDSLSKPFQNVPQLPTPSHLLRRLQVIVPAAAVAGMRTAATPTIPPPARVFGDSRSLTLFRRVPSSEGWPWEILESEFKSAAIAEGSAALWIDGLASAMQDALLGRPHSAGIPTFFCPSDLRAYRPALSKVEYDDDGSAHFELVFVDLPPELEAYPPGEIGKAAHLINLARMFRWGVLEAFAHEFDESTTPKELAAIGRRLLGAIHNVTAESLNRGVRRQYDVLSAFPNPRTRDELQAVFVAWPISLARLEKAISTCDALEMQLALEEMFELNRTVLRSSANRFGELISDLVRDERNKLHATTIRARHTRPHGNAANARGHSGKRSSTASSGKRKETRTVKAGRTSNNGRATISRARPKARKR